MKKTVIALSILIGGISLTACQNNNPQNIKDHFIPVDSANKMIRSYLNSIADSDTEKPQLQSLIMDADALREYLKDTSIKEVKVMFAHTMDYINSGHGGQYAGYRPGALTIIFAGYNLQGNYVLAPGNLVPDGSSPCPPFCPGTGTASLPLIVKQ